ncbi:MAG TPA: tRNA pseudouridine(38-40) synthase TruA [Gammaproteobacteria bacterium]|nr:tRNA pseudouridine(38-40) synthase TruA [Gammaproteobacteria bacterium]
MMRWALGIEYEGTCYHGWQSQTNEKLMTVQRCLEQAVSRVADHAVEVVCAGRTDKGVHATSQVVHFDTARPRDSRAWVMGVNHGLPEDIRVIWAKEVSEDFHARFSAVARRYHYIIYNHRIASAILRRHVTWFIHPLDEDKMRVAANYLLGEHDFSAFRGADCQAKTTRRCVHRLDIVRRGDFIKIDIQANAFLHHMVRNIAGVLIEIGVAKRQPVWAQEVLMGRDRKLGGITAPPEGLYLVDITYSPLDAIPGGRDSVISPF